MPGLIRVGGPRYIKRINESAEAHRIHDFYTWVLGRLETLISLLKKTTFLRVLCVCMGVLCPCLVVRQAACLV